ncbi:DUF5994 family protein [Amycolatopsis saalfeldensis]|uniref:Uncharacterized protein n=1 Tax=Amycolatopsis saalfeldensis TaxID=394193 RepID=A0A1H8VVI6_9PSEU|nr:DUF5994 family protein [Amycolatopsis saalfeldensis]SEP18928.1 hypothetical protein SAMN04489732_104296 [Amycolatopsis saalfeldensis]
MPSGPQTITTAPENTAQGRETTAAADRVRLKPEGPSSGQVDGAWWPRSDDFVAELPALLAELEPSLKRVEHVTYSLADRAVVARRLPENRLVRLEGFRAQTAGTVTVVGPERRLTLLVVPPATDSVLAHRVLKTAAEKGNSATVETLLAECDAPGR